MQEVYLLVRGTYWSGSVTEVDYQVDIVIEVRTLQIRIHVKRKIFILTLE